MPKTRKERRKASKAAYLAGRAKNPHRHTPVLRRSLEESCSAEPVSSTGVCPQCAPILSRYSETFKNLVHQGTELKRRKAINPHPKKPDTTHYRDVVQQNDWLRNNVFDSLGNYLYCAACIRASLGLSKDRLARQRNIKRQQSQQPIVEMEKSKVEEKRLGDCVIMPAGLETSFKSWWRSQDASTIVQVRYPHERHGNAGKTSNSAKSSLREDFLEFVDLNTQPNGRSADSSGPTSYFIPKFSTIQTPKPTVSHYEERLSRSVVGEFNRVQRERGKQEISNGSSHNWLKAHRPKVAICPHQEDYCDTCSKSKVARHAKQTTINRLLQSANASPEEVKKLEDEVKCLKQQNENHRDDAKKSHEHYTEVTRRCCKEWLEITSLEHKEALTEEEKLKLEELKTRFNLVIAADYQMCKLVPYWGCSAQPGSTYYLQKLNHDIFGIVNHSSGASTVYLFDERVGPKNTDHTISYLTDYISRLPSWVKRVHLFLDNTASTNKNYFLMGWAYEMVQQQRVHFFRISFLIAGHTKFSPDLLFSKIAQSYNRSDVFTTGELKDVISTYAEVIIDEGSIVQDWRTPVTGKFSKLPGIRTLHDFIYVRNPVTLSVVARVRKFCHSGSFEHSTGHVLRGKDARECIFPDEDEDTYAASGKIRNLTESKLKHLKSMYSDFVPAERCLPFIT